MVNKHFLFTYGTLKQGYQNDMYLARADFLGDFEVNCARLYAMNYAPALVCDKLNTLTSQKNKVKGELYLVSDEHLASIDRLEGHPQLYERQQLCWTEILPGKGLKCILTYVWKGTVDGYTQIYEWTKKPSAALRRM